MKSIIIGSGFGGIAAALRLKARNHNVTLIEKHPDLGGRARVFKKNGFTFDAGPTVITAPYLIEELFQIFNKKPEDYINHSLYFEAKTFLHGLLMVEDKMSMSYGLENRVPFLDNDLVDFAMRCPVGLKLNNLNEVIRINENHAGDKQNIYFQNLKITSVLVSLTYSAIF